MSESTSCYCLKCKSQQQMVDEKLTITKNGRKMLGGTCAKCGTKMSKFVSLK